MRAIGTGLLIAGLAGLAISASAAPARKEAAAKADMFGRTQITTLALDPSVLVRSATYMPSGKVLVAYNTAEDSDPHMIRLATVDDDGRNFRPFFAQRIPEREKDNGLRYMVFADNTRIFMGDFIIGCAPSLDQCSKPTLSPVDYPAEVASGSHIAHRWSEIVIAPDNRHISWTTLMANYSAIVFLGELEKRGDRYAIVKPQIVSTLDPFRKDPAHADGVLVDQTRGGEVKQFVHGGAGLSLAGAVHRDTPDSVVQDIPSGRVDAITDTPGYTETTIFSPDERLGVTMTTRFSKRSDPAVLGLLPRPYPVSLNMGLSMVAYEYAVTGVRRARPGNVGPALIDIARSMREPGYMGRNLNTDENWVFHSPMSWHPGGQKAMWIEGHRGDHRLRVQIVHLPDYRPAAAVPTRTTPPSGYGSSDLSLVKPYAGKSEDINVKVYGRKSGFITFARTPQGTIRKTYTGFSDDGRGVYNGFEQFEVNPRGRSTYTAQIDLSGAKPGKMDLKITFGPLGGPLSAQVIFDRGPDGKPLSWGYAEYAGRRASVDTLVP